MTVFVEGAKMAGGGLWNLWGSIVAKVDLTSQDRIEFSRSDLETLQFAIRPNTAWLPNNWGIVQHSIPRPFLCAIKQGEGQGKLCTRGAQPPLVRNITPNLL